MIKLHRSLGGEITQEKRTTVGMQSRRPLFCGRHLRLILLSIAGFMLFHGCGKPAVVTVPVEGRITYDGGEWPKAGMVFFAPIGAMEGYPRRGGQGRFEKDGTFKATTFVAGDGLIPGTYAVNLLCWDVPPGVPGKPPKSFIPDKYLHGKTSGFMVNVPADDSATVVVELDVPKT